MQIEIGPDLNKPYVQVVKQQVKDAPQGSTRDSSQVTYKVHLIRSYDLE